MEGSEASEISEYSEGSEYTEGFEVPMVPGYSRVRRRLFLAFVVFGVAVGESGAKHLLADASFCEETFLLRFKKFVEEI